MAGTCESKPLESMGMLVPGNPHLIDVKIDLRGIQSKGSEQTDPLKALPTTSSCWMGFRIAPSNPSEFDLLMVATPNPFFDY